MGPYACTCGNRLFIENSQCVACGAELGWCPACRTLTTLVPSADGAWSCGNETCRAPLLKCRNYAIENVCNRCVQVLNEIASGEATADALCDYCQLTEVIPDLSIDGNRQRWYELESAKRRLLLLLELLALPYGGAASGVALPLSFDFKADAIPADGVWRLMSDERVYTGHQDGKITINVREADHVEREKLRVDLNEAHRTLCGHFRHEIGHYYWQLLVEGQREAEFKAVFGDHEQPPYDEALNLYYQNGPRPDWQASYVSAYATMHPWEDFAETFALYLDMAAVLDTAIHAGIVANIDVRQSPLNEIIVEYQKLGVAANELNRSMGLTDLVPEVLSEGVRAKLAFIHDLVRSAAGRAVEGEERAASSLVTAAE